MSIYEGFLVYGPYTRRDGRQHVVLVHHNTEGKIDQQKTVSYPKYLVECYLNRYLTKEETIDHIDGDFTNNDFSNLRVVPRDVHCKSHVKSKPIIQKVCNICGKTFETTDNSRITCGSPYCRGKCAHLNGYNKGNSLIRNKNIYQDNRNIVSEISAIEPRRD